MSSDFSPHTLRVSFGHFVSCSSASQHDSALGDSFSDLSGPGAIG